MIKLSQYIAESIKHLSPNVKGIIVFDIDDTILKVDSSSINVYKTVPGEREKTLTTAEFAKDPDASDPAKRSWFSYRDFHNPEKVYKSIISGTPIIRNLRIMDSYISAGYDFCFLTARSCEDVVKRALDDFLRHRDKNTGALSRLGSVFNKAMSHAINDTEKNYPGITDADKKANVLRNLCKKYDKVIFVDDDAKNIQAARNLNLKNLRVINAWEN